MLNGLNTYYNAVTSDFAVVPASRDFMRSTTKCLEKTFIMMQSALGTDASLEIGAHDAQFSLKMAKTYGEAISICALEASPRTHAYFSKKCHYKDCGVDYINALVSDRAGDVVFYEHVDESREAASWVSSLLVRDIRVKGSTRRTRVTVKSVLGDTLIERKFKNKEKISLWIDVEGAQYEVLNSLSKSFERGIINSVYIEVEQKKFWPKQKMLVSDIIAFMREYNFSPFLRDKQTLNQYNIIFVNNSIEGYDFSRYFDYYRMLLLKSCGLLQ
jgi:FkbM family methyltransferase